MSRSRSTSRPASRPSSRPSSRPASRPSSPEASASALEKFKELSQELTAILENRDRPPAGDADSELAATIRNIDNNLAYSVDECIHPNILAIIHNMEIAANIMEREHDKIMEGIAHVKNSVETTNRRVTRVEGKIDRCLWFIERIAEKKGIFTQ